MEEASIIVVDLAKNVFQLHGSVVYRKKLSRPQFARFMAKHPACVGGDGGVPQRPSLAPGHAIGNVQKQNGGPFFAPWRKKPIKKEPSAEGDSGDPCR